MKTYAKAHGLKIPKVSTVNPFWGGGKRTLAWRVSGDAFGAGNASAQKTQDLVDMLFGIPFLIYGKKGPTVERLQRDLNTNPYTNSRKLTIDGEMGPLTCAAIKSAKYWMGYASAHMDPDLKDQVAGEWFFDLLEKNKSLPSIYKTRRANRLEKAKANDTPQIDLRLKALGIVKGELGTMEAGGYSNVIKYNTWWGWGAVAYCVIGVSYCWVKAGSVAFKKGSRWANTDAMLADGKAGRNGIHITHSPQPGTPGVIDFSGHSDPDHAITFVKDNGNGTCETIEFNVVGSNGMGGVWRKDRPLRQCWWFAVEH